MKNHEFPPECGLIRPSGPQRATFLMERLLAQGCLNGCQQLTICMDESTAAIECVENVRHEGCFRRCQPCRKQRLDAWERWEVPLSLRARDRCGATRWISGTATLRIPLQIFDSNCEGAMICSLLLINLCPQRVVQTCGNTLELQVDVSAQLYLTCMQALSLGVPPATPHCAFPPLYPQPRMR